MRLCGLWRALWPTSTSFCEGDKPEAVFLIVEGFACRYKITSTGDRHIMAYLIPGDLGDLHVFMLREMDHNIGTLSPCRFVRIPQSEIWSLLDNPRLARALICALLVDAAVLREWLVNIGRRTAEERIAHLFCELLLRMRAVGLATTDSYELPITQNRNCGDHGAVGCSREPRFAKLTPTTVYCDRLKDNRYARF